MEILRLAPPKIRPKKLAPEENESAARRMQSIPPGTGPEERGRITGDADRLAEGIIGSFTERNFISRSH